MLPTILPDVAPQSRTVVVSGVGVGVGVGVGEPEGVGVEIGVTVGVGVVDGVVVGVTVTDGVDVGVDVAVGVGVDAPEFSVSLSPPQALKNIRIRVKTIKRLEKASSCIVGNNEHTVSWSCLKCSSSTYAGVVMGLINITALYEFGCMLAYKLTNPSMTTC